MAKATEIVGGIVGWTVMLAFTALTILSFPFFMVALMRGYAFHWWSALIVGVLIHAIPGIRTLAYLVGAVFGGYHVVASGFDWDAAVHPVSEERLAAFRANARPELLTMCMSEPVLIERSRSAGFRLNAFCPCYADRLLSVGKLEDPSSTPGPETQLAVMKAQNECLALSR